MLLLFSKEESIWPIKILKSSFLEEFKVLVLDTVPRKSPIEWINGFVQNLRDGSVLIHVNGETSIVDEFVSKIKDSPTSYGRVDNMKITNINEIHDKGFIIK